MVTAAEAPSYEDRVVGSFLGAMAGDILGAPVEDWTPSRVQSSYKYGLTAYQKTHRG